MKIVNVGGKLVFTDRWTMQYSDYKGKNHIIDVCEDDAKLLDKSYDGMAIEFLHEGDKARLIFTI